MPVTQYTAAQLLALRESPLCVKPDNLPAIEQWIDESATASSSSAKQPQQQRVSKMAETASPMGSFSTGSGRPTLGTRASGLRGNGGSGSEDISLGPPKTMFPSSRNVSRMSDLPDRNAPSTGDTPSTEEPESARSRFFSDRQLNRRSMNNEKEGRDNRDSWTSVRERREKQAREEGEGRNGFGERGENRWSRDDRRNGDRAGGWREREQQRRDREHGREEKEPEWMDDPVVKKDQELNFGMARTQEEFQKWKEGMSKKTKGEVEKEEEPVQPEAAPAQPALEPKLPQAPLKLDGFEGGMFGGWGAGNTTAGSQGATTPGATGTMKSATAKPKASRFASMFSKPAEETPPTPGEHPSSQQQSANGSANKTTAEDQEGFNRVLQMLGSAKLGQPTPPSNEQTPASPPPPIKTSGLNGTAPGKPKSRFTDLFSPKSPERLQSPQQGGVQLGDSVLGSEAYGPNSAFGRMMPERQMSEQQLPRTQGPQSTMSPDPSGIPFNALREQQPRPASGRMNDMAMFDPPSRGAASPDVNIQNLLAQNRQRQHGPNDSQQLLNLLRKDTSNSRPASQQAIPNNGGIDQATLHQWIENQQRAQMPAEPHAPKPRVPQQPPGLFEEQLMRNYPTEQQQRPDKPPMPPGMPEPQRRPSQRPPPGFFDEQSIFLQQQQQQQQQQQMRRQFADGPPPPPQPQQMPGAGRRPSGHPNLPQMQIPQGQQFPLSEFHHLTSPTGGPQGPPPPGFNPHMQRQPPGFHNINIFQQQQQQQRELPPSGFGGMQSPPAAGAPPGFFGVPPGFAQMQQGRPPVDGRGRGFVEGGFDPGLAMGPRR